MVLKWTVGPGDKILLYNHWVLDTEDDYRKPFWIKLTRWLTIALKERLDLWP